MKTGETVSPVVVGLPIELSNRFVDNFERVTRFMTLGIKIRKRQTAATFSVTADFRIRIIQRIFCEIKYFTYLCSNKNVKQYCLIMEIYG